MFILLIVSPMSTISTLYIYMMSPMHLQLLEIGDIIYIVDIGGMTLNHLKGILKLTCFFTHLGNPTPIVPSVSGGLGYGGQGYFNKSLIIIVQNMPL